MIKKLILILVLFYFNCPAQSDSVLINVNNAIEDLLEEQEEETDNTELYEVIAFYVEHPININEASAKDLIKLPYLDPSAAELIISHRDKYGSFFSTNELYSVKELPADLVEKILPFLAVHLSEPADKEFKEETNTSVVDIRSRLITDLQERKGFRDKNFKGSPIKMYNRFNYNYKRSVRAGLLTEKDAGESSYDDFLSGYLNLTDIYGFGNIIFGDYQIRFGQGLALWNAYGISKGSDAVFSSKKSSGAIKPSTSASENNFFRGAAFRYNWEHANLTGFYSNSRLDAAVDSTGKITSLSVDGLHRTDNEYMKRHSVQEKAWGMLLEYSFSQVLNAGLLYYNTALDHSFMYSNIYDIKEANFNYYSGYFDLLFNNSNIYGELALNGNSGPAYLTGLILTPSPKFCYSLLIRNYPVEFNSLHGSRFGERSGARSGEFGIYNGFRWRTSIGTFNLYFDQFKFPYASYTNPLPSDGNEFMIRYTTKVLKNCEAGLKYRLGNKERAFLLDGEEIMAKRHKQSFRLEYSYSVNSRLRLKTRFEYISVLVKDYFSREEGFLFYEDIRLIPLEGLLLYGRIIFFRTDSFNSAIYEYENDLAGILSSRSLYCEGARYYIAIRYRIYNKISSL